MNFLFKGECIDYEYYGSNNNVVLFLHGWGGNKNSFISTINLLKHNYNILSITMPTIQTTSEIWNLQDYCSLVYAILKTHNIDSIYVVCHSFGFRVASLLKNKIKINKLVVTGGAGPIKKNVFKRIQSQNNKILLANKKFKFLYKHIASQDYLNLSKTNKETFKNIVNTNTKNFIKFNCPILLFWGRFDSATKFWIAKLIRKQNNAKLISTKGDHFAYLTSNTLFNHEVIKFLN